MQCFDDPDDRRRFPGGDVHLPAFGDRVIQILIKQSGADIECGAVILPLLFVKDELLSAIDGIALVVFQKSFDDRTGRIFSGKDVLALIIGRRTAEGAACALDLQRVRRVGVGVVDLDVDDRFAGRSEALQ